MISYIEVLTRGQLQSIDITFAKCFNPTACRVTSDLIVPVLVSVAQQ
jgi:hypothetical protein